MGDEKQILDALILEITNRIREANRAGKRVTPEDITEALAAMQQEAGLPVQYSTPQQMIERVRQIEEAPDLASNVAVNIANGMTFRLLDDALALVGADATAEELRRVTKASHRETPWIAGLSEAAGGLAAPGLASLGVLRGTGSLARAAGSGLLVGGVEGAVYGLGEGEGSIEERLPNITRGAAYGAAGGAVLGPAAYGIGKGYRWLTGRTGQTVEEQAREFAQRQAAESPRGVEGVLEDLERTQRTAPDFTLADVPEMRPLAVGAARASQEARSRFRSILPRRARTAWERVDDYLMSAVSETDVPQTVQQRRQMLVQRRNAGHAAYDQLENTVTNVMSEELGSTMTNELAYKAWQRANAMVTEQGDAPLRNIIQKTKDGFSLTGEQADFRTLQAMKHAMDDLVEEAPTRLGQKRAQTRNAFYDVVKDEVSNYGDAQRAWFQLHEEARAIDAGANILRQSAEEVRDNLARFTDTPTAADAYRISAMEQFSEELRKKTRRADPTKGRTSQILDPSAETEAKLSQLFPDEQEFANALDQLDAERLMMETTRDITGRGMSDAPVNLAASLQQLGAGGEALQRLSIIPVAPGVGAARLGADIVQGGLRRGVERRASLLGSELSQRMSGTSADAVNLLTGRFGGLRPGAPSYLTFRTPALTFAALQGEDGG